MNKAFLALALAMMTGAALISTKPVQAMNEGMARSQLHLFALDFNVRVLSDNDGSSYQEWFQKQEDENGYWFLKKASFNRRLTDRERFAALFLLFKGFPERSETLLKQLDKDTFNEFKPDMQNYVHRLNMYLHGVPPPQP